MPTPRQPDTMIPFLSLPLREITNPKPINFCFHPNKSYIEKKSILCIYFM
jgi:hypothetical protein